LRARRRRQTAEKHENLLKNRWKAAAGDIPLPNPIGAC
jgi:hypothetical protein